MNILIKNSIARSVVFGAVIAFGAQAAFAMPAGRLAYIADGNSPDPDDLGASSATLAILRAAGLADKLVHCAHSCDTFIPANGPITPAQEQRRQEQMQAANDDTAAEWGGYGHIATFWNCRTQENQQTDDLAAAINASTASDPLTIIEAGEPDVIYIALDKAQQNKSQFVTIITHSTVNDNSGKDYDLSDITRDFDVSVTRIPDQNQRLRGPIGQFHWARDSSDSRLNIVWDYVKLAEQDGIHEPQNGNWDISDAGMTYFWAFGTRQPTLNNIRNLLEDWVEDNPQGGGNPPPPPPPPSGDFVSIFKRNALDFCIDGGGGPGSNGQNVRLFTFSNLGRQQWEEISRGNDFYSYKRRGTDHVLDGGAGGVNGQNVRLWAISSTNQNQQWKKVPMGNGRFVRLQKRNANGFSIHGGVGASDRQNIELKANSNSEQNQHWEIK